MKVSAHHKCLSVIDSILSLFVFSPLVVFYWRGTWQLLDHYLFNGSPISSSWASLTLGLVIPFTFAVIQQPLDRTFKPEKNWCLYFVIARLYTTIFCFGCVNHWRGVWTSLDNYTGTGWISAASTVVIGVVSLTLMKTLRVISAPPCLVVPDAPEIYFTFPTMFRTAHTKKFYIYVLDCVFSVAVVGSLGVFVWRGSWLLLDIYLFPDNKEWSALGSLVLGYSISLIMFLLQLPLSMLARRLKGIWRLVITDVNTLVSFAGVVNHWRGVWNCSNRYILPDDLLASNWMTHAVGLLCLMLLYNGNSIIVRGVLFDGEESGGKCVIFPCNYIRYFKQGRKEDRQEQVAIAMVPTDNQVKTAVRQANTATTSVSTQTDSIQVDRKTLMELQPSLINKLYSLPRRKEETKSSQEID